MRHAFSNNAVTTLAAGISNSATTITLTSDAGFDSSVGSDGLVQALTITDPANVLPPEVVYATAIPGAGQRTVTRGQEGTTAQTWVADAIVSARVTAGMLGSFAQVTDGALSLSAYGVRGRDWLGGGAQTGGFPVLQLVRSNLGGSSNEADGNLSREVVGGTLHLNLGTAATWASGEHYYGHAVVVPPVPDSRQYCFEPSTQGATSLTTTTPSFTPDDSCPALGGAGEVGKWVSINPAALEQWISGAPGNSVLVVTEVGFVCASHGGGSAPVVSIGTDLSPTRFASGVALSQITAAGHVHRIPVSVGGAACTDSLTFELVTPSSGDFRGRFYWKGFFLEMAV